MKITKDDVTKALDSFEEKFQESVSKASEHGLDNPEGADLGNPAKEKMSAAAKSKKAADCGPMPMKKGHDGVADEGDEDGDSGEHEESEEAEHPMPKKSMKAKKSFHDDVPEEIQTKIDVSEFLKSLVDHTGECIDELAGEVAKSESRMVKSHAALTNAVEDIQKSQAKIGIVLKAICQRIGIIENAPAKPAKADTVAKSGAQERKFESGLEGETQEPVFKSLSQNPTVAKSQISGVLCDMVRKGEADAMDVIGFETNGFLRPDLMPKLKQALN